MWHLVSCPTRGATEHIQASTPSLLCSHIGHGPVHDTSKYTVKVKQHVKALSVAKRLYSLQDEAGEFDRREHIHSG